MTNQRLYPKCFLRCCVNIVERRANLVCEERVRENLTENVMLEVSLETK